MKHMVIYWEQDSNDLHLLDDVPYLTCGNDGMEVLVSDIGAEQIREIVGENPDSLTLDTDEAATSAHVAEAMSWRDMALKPVWPVDKTDLQDVLRILGIDDYWEITSIIEDELTDEDCRVFHEGEMSENVKRLVDIFGPFQVWGVDQPRQGEEPLNVIWPA